MFNVEKTSGRFSGWLRMQNSNILAFSPIFALYKIQQCTLSHWVASPTLYIPQLN